jgi:hypothetical protein
MISMKIANATNVENALARMASAWRFHVPRSNCFSVTNNERTKQLINVFLKHALLGTNGVGVKMPYHATNTATAPMTTSPLHNRDH